jgi:hypothetical protein
MDVHPTKNVSIGIDPYPNMVYTTHHNADDLGLVEKRLA